MRTPFTLAAAAAALAALPVGPALADHDTRSFTVRSVERSFHSTSKGTTSSDRLLRDNRKVGHAHYICPKSDKSHCTASFLFYGAGHIYVRFFYPRPAKTSSFGPAPAPRGTITGGTGAYRGAQGTATATNQYGNRNTVTFHLQLP